MSVLIKGMEKPEHCGYCRFRYDGICHALQKTQYSMNECPLVVIDDAGLDDTISRQAAIDAVTTWLHRASNPLNRSKYNEGEVAAYKTTLSELKKIPSVNLDGNSRWLWTRTTCS